MVCGLVWLSTFVIEMVLSLQLPVVWDHHKCIYSYMLVSLHFPKDGQCWTVPHHVHDENSSHVAFERTKSSVFSM